jgi:putative flippase GtrA
MNILLYFFVGGISFLGNLGIFSIFVQIFRVHWIVGNIAGFIAGTLINYVLSARFIFESRLYSRRDLEALLTLVVSVVGVCLETLLISLAHDFASVDLVVSKIGAAGIVFFWNYGARRFFVFGAIKRFGSR